MFEFSLPEAVTLGNPVDGGGGADGAGGDVLVGRAFGTMGLAAATLELDFSASSPLSESESLLSEESEESLEDEEPLPSFSFFGNDVGAREVPVAAAGGGDPVLLEPSLLLAGPKLCCTSSRRFFSSFSFAVNCSLAGVFDVSSTSFLFTSLPDFFKQVDTYFSSSRKVEGFKVSKSISISSGLVSPAPW